MDIRIGSTLTGPNDTDIIVDELLGQGGFGQVFGGHLPDNTRVAIKTVLTSSLDPDELAALQNEANLAKDINHPNVVRVLYVNSGEDALGNPPYIVMEFVDGDTLRSILEAHRANGSIPSIDELREMFLQIAQGMQAINEKVVHRDLKPENVLVEKSTGRLKIADFGLAKLADAATRSETFKGWGTRPYQAPEAFELGPNTTAMDIYAAGVTFFEMATLTWPIQPKAGDNSPLAWRNAHLLSPPTDLRTTRSDMPTALVQLIALMLQKDQKRRPTSWEVIIDRLKKDAGEIEGKLDVSFLVQKATATLIEASAQESRQREEREKLAERNALLQQAVQEPISVLKDLVDAFNDASDVGKLSVEEGNDLVEVTGSPRGKRLLLQTKIINDLRAGQNGIYRIIGMARIDPTPAVPTQMERVYDHESFGSFNFGYRVSRPEERFGNWNMLRFEHNPLMGKSGYPHWFAVDFDDLPHQLEVLNALGTYQNQQRPLDHEWFRLLLAHLV